MFATAMGIIRSIDARIALPAYACNRRQFRTELASVGR